MLSGGERIRGRFMRQDFIEFPSTWVITLVTNHKPTIQGADNGIWRRIRFVPWTVSLPKDKQRPQEEVVTELLAEGPAILAWMVEGLRDWQRDHHWMADAVRAATDNYRAEQDVLGGFLADCCELGPRYTVTVGALYDAYTQWAKRNGEEPLYKNTFSTRLTARGLAKDRRPDAKRERIWRGIRLRTHSDTVSVSAEKSKPGAPIGTYTESVSECVRTPSDPNPGEGCGDSDTAKESAGQGAPLPEACVICGLPTLLRGPDGRPLCSFCAERSKGGVFHERWPTRTPQNPANPATPECEEMWEEIGDEPQEPGGTFRINMTTGKRERLRQGPGNAAAPAEPPEPCRLCGKADWIWSPAGYWACGTCLSADTATGGRGDG